MIHNPGTIPDSRYNDSKTDVTVVFESPYPSYQSKADSLAELPDHRSEYCYMINSLPGMGQGGLRKFVHGISENAEFLFVTENDKDYYESFGSDWAKFVDVVPT